MDLIPGFCQGVARVLISYPFDALKVFSQTNNQRPWVNLKHHIIKNPSIFYRGVGVPLVTVSLDRAIQYKYFEELRSTYNPYLVGAGMGLLSSLLSVPMQFITSNILLMTKSEFGSLPKYITTYLRSNGLIGLYKGYSIEVPRSALATSVYLGTYGNLRQHLAQSSNLPTQWETMLYAIVASWTSWIVAFPLDTIRTLYQVDTTGAQSLNKTISQRYRTMGAASFWRGLTPVLLRTTPSSVVGMIVYESVRSRVLE